MRVRTMLLRTLALALAFLAAAPARARVDPGVEAGLAASKVTFEAGGVPADPDYGTTWSAGVTLDAPVAKRVTLASALRYVEYGEITSASFPTTGGSVRFQRHLVWRYLALPLMVRVRPLATAGVYLAGGFEGGYLLTVWHQAEVRTEGGTMPVSAAQQSDGRIFEGMGTFFADPNGAYSHGDLAVLGAAGWEFPSAVGHVRVEARYNHGLVDIASAGGLERQTRAFELLLGLRR
jgi:hypothetical protein